MTTKLVSKVYVVTPRRFYASEPSVKIKETGLSLGRLLRVTDNDDYVLYRTDEAVKLPHKYFDIDTTVLLKNIRGERTTYVGFHLCSTRPVDNTFTHCRDLFPGHVEFCDNTLSAVSSEFRYSDFFVEIHFSNTQNE